MTDLEPIAWLGGMIASGLADVTSDVSALDSSGRWAVAMTFEGEPICARFENWTPGFPDEVANAWVGPAPSSYRSSLGRVRYETAVERVRESIAVGEVYQANICRVLSADLPHRERSDVAALSCLLRHGNPAPFAGFIRLPVQRLEVATASPELFLRRSGAVVESGPIKGTARTAAALLPKDEAENVMIVDLVRNDLSIVCQTGTVEVPALLAVEHHPGVAHLVSTVRGQLGAAIGWPQLFGATMPPGSVSGAPKSSALQVIANLEPTPRGLYCGAVGWVDADQKTAEMAVAIRTFWITRRDDVAMLNFGTGAGITWGSDPAAEWDETELKAAHLLSVAAGHWP